MIPLARLRVIFLLLLSAFFCEIMEEVSDGLKRVFQCPSPEFGELFKLPNDYYVCLVWATDDIA